MQKTERTQYSGGGGGGVACCAPSGAHATHGFPAHAGDLPLEYLAFFPLGFQSKREAARSLAYGPVCLFHPRSKRKASEIFFKGH